jgi:hypothetical protein
LSNLTKFAYFCPKKNKTSNIPVVQCMLSTNIKFITAVCETKFYGIIDQFLFYIDLTVHYIHILKIWHRPAWFYIDIVYRSTVNFAHCHCLNFLYITRVQNELKFESSFIITKRHLQTSFHKLLCKTLHSSNNQLGWMTAIILKGDHIRTKIGIICILG